MLAGSCLNLKAALEHLLTACLLYVSAAHMHTGTAVGSPDQASWQHKLLTHCLQSQAAHCLAQAASSQTLVEVLEQLVLTA